MVKIYVASSWRNLLQPNVVKALRKIGHEVYDFRNPHDGYGFQWSMIDEGWQNWTQKEFREALNHSVAEKGFNLDMDALAWCDACVLLMPCGRSAHLELGWAVGSGKKTIIFLQGGEPELMYKMIDHICLSIREVADALELIDGGLNGNG